MACSKFSSSKFSNLSQSVKSVPIYQKIIAMKLAVMLEKPEHSASGDIINTEYQFILNRLDLHYKDVVMDIGELPYFYNALERLVTISEKRPLDDKLYGLPTFAGKSLAMCMYSNPPIPQFKYGVMDLPNENSLEPVESLTIRNTIIYFDLNVGVSLLEVIENVAREFELGEMRRGPVVPGCNPRYNKVHRAFILNMNTKETGLCVAFVDDETEEENETDIRPPVPKRVEQSTTYQEQRAMRRGAVFPGCQPCYNRVYPTFILNMNTKGGVCVGYVDEKEENETDTRPSVPRRVEQSSTYQQQRAV